MPRKFNTGLFRFDFVRFANLLLVLCILLGTGLLFLGLNWDDGFHLHPDERFLCIIAPQLNWPQSFGEYFHSARATLNPFNHGTSFFVYGQLPLVLVKAIAGWAGRDDYQSILLVGRLVSACFESGTLLLVFLIGRHTSSTRVGLLAAALLGFTALHVQQAHFWVVDGFASFFGVGAFYFALRTVEPGRLHPAWPASFCGVFLGAAAASKLSALLFVVVIAIIVNFYRRTSTLRWEFSLALILLTAVLAFRLLHPVAFLGSPAEGVLSLWGFFDLRPNPQFWSAVAHQGQISSGQIDVPFNLQWHDRADYFWPLKNLGGWAMGWPLLLSAVAGVALSAGRLLHRRTVPPAVLAASLWCVFVLLVFGGQFSKFTRYYLIATPFAALLAAWFLLELSQARASIIWKIASTTIIATVLAWTALWALAIASIYTRPHPRVAATEWILHHVPAGDVISNESAWDDALPLRGSQRYERLDLDLFAADNEDKRQKLLQDLDRTQWIFISSPRVRGTIPRLPQRFPLTAEYYRALLDGRLGFRLAQEFSSFPQLAGMELRDEHFEEALHVYDHPRVLLFVKTDKYSPSNAAAILSQNLLDASR